MLLTLEERYHIHGPFIQLQNKHCASYAETEHGEQTHPGLLAPFCSQSA